MREKGFTLIELVIVVTILAIVAAVAIPTFQNLRQRGQISATRGILGEIRSAITIYRANEITSGRSNGVAGTRGYPAWGQLCDTQDNGVSGCACSGTMTPKVMENGETPDNPFAREFGRSETCLDGVAVGSSPGVMEALTDTGWLYQQSSGRFWANTQTSGVNENTF